MTFASLQGQTLGKYRVLEPLGRGGMARVYRGYHAQLDRYVAIKVLRPDLFEDEPFMARFRREAQTVAALRHPNIVQVYDFDVQEHLSYMVMELLDGDTLHTRLNDYRVRQETMPTGEMARVLLDILAGLGYAHSQGMVHRDIKPANVLLTRQGQAVLADFGIAQMVGGTRHTMSGALLGTLNYMAPEQGLEGVSDERSDLYSVGVVFYEMLTRQPPYEADTPLAVLMKHVNDPLPLPAEIDPSIPLAFERVVLKALSKQPDDRYQTAEEMASAVAEAAAASSITIPDRISLPMSFATPEAPQEPVSVYSGTARNHLRQQGVDVGDTLSGTAVDWTDDLTSLKQAEPAPVQHAKTGPTSAETTGPVISNTIPRQDSIPPITTILRGGLLFVIGLPSMGLLTALFDAPVFEFAWPAIFLWMTTFLAWMMRDRQQIWLLIPTGALGTLSILLGFSVTFNYWDHWIVSWILLALGVWFSIYGAIRLSKRYDRRVNAYRLGRVIARAALILSIFLIFVSLFH